MIEQNTIPLMFWDRVKKYSDRTIIRDMRYGRYDAISWLQCSEMVECLCLYLISLGVKNKDNILLLSENRLEWVISDLAIASTGAVNVTTFLPCGSSRVQKIIKECRPKIIIISSLNILKGITVDQDITKKIITFDSETGFSNGPKEDFQECLAQGKKLRHTDSHLLQLRIKSVHKDDIATIIYNINATGEYKGVMLTHGALMFNCRAFAKMILIKKRDKIFHFNSLSQVFGRICGCYLNLYRGSTIIFEDFRKIINFKKSNLTIILASPYIYNIMYKIIIKKLRSLPRVKRKITMWVIIAQEKYIKHIPSRKKKPLLIRLNFLVARAVRFLFISPRIKEHFLKSNARIYISGGAYLDKKITLLFNYLGLPLLEGYGLSECGIISVNTLNKWKPTSVGKILPGINVRIDNNGEVLIKGPNVMKGYYNDPYNTDQRIKNQWMHTGDTGYVDKDNFLSIQGLKKDIFVLTIGVNINPRAIEEALKKDEYIDDISVFGDRKPYLVALLTPNAKSFEVYAAAEKLFNAGESPHERRAKTEQFFRNKITQSLSGFSKFEQIRKFMIMERNPAHDLKTVYAGTKEGRGAIYKNYEQAIRSMYD